MTGIQEKPDIIMYILAGIYVMKPKIFEYIPEGEYFGMDSLIKKLLSEDKPVTKYDLKEYWLDIGRMADWDEAQEIYQTHFNGGL